MSTYDDYLRHENNTDTLYAYPVKKANFDSSDAVLGDNDDTPDDSNLYWFNSLDSAFNYEVRVRAGSDPVVGDEVIADIAKPVETSGGDSTEFDGARTITLRVVDGNDDPILSANVVISLGNEKYTYTTDAAGQIVTTDGGQLTLDDETYSVAVTLRGYTGATATIIVSETTTSFADIELTAFTPSAPPTPDFITVFAYFKLNDDPVSGAKLTAELGVQNQATDGVVLSKSKTEDTTDSNGYAELVLIRSTSFAQGDGIYRIRITEDKETHVDISKALPNQASVNLEDLIEA